MTKTPATTQALQQIYLRISLGSWVGYTLDEANNQTQECIYAPTRGVCTLRAHPKKLAQVYLRMQIRDTLRTTEQQTKGKDDSEGIRTLNPE